MNLITIDVEIYENYFLLSALNSANGKVKHFEMYEGQPLNKPALMKLMSDNTTLSFNGNSFDLPIIVAALSGWPVSKLKGLCDKIIQSNAPSWMICRDYKLKTPDRWDHIDIIEVAPGMVSLKVYGGRLHYATIQDLPIEPSALISPAERATLRDYCVNDLQTTYALYKSLEKQVDLRVSMSKQYGVDLRSKSDAQIAETVIKSELQKQTGKQYRKPELPDGVTFKYQDPHIVEFQTEQLQKMFKTVLNIRFGLGANGAVKMPPELAKSKIKIGYAEYTMGIGGLHSCEKAQLVVAGKDEHLIDVDVASYYPNIILQQALAPKSMGAPFLKVYQSIVDRRIRATVQLSSSRLQTSAGRSRLPKIAKYIIAEINKAIPIGVTLNSSKAINGLPLTMSGLFNHHPSIRSLSMINGDEPTNVRQPPVIAQKPIGINILLAGILSCRPIRMVAGKNSAAAPIFCIKLDITATVDEIITMILASLCPASFIICEATTFMTPVLFSPAPRIITAMIETTALELSPAMASSGLITPDNGNNTIISRPTRSTRSKSKTNRTMAKPKRQKTMIMSVVNTMASIPFSFAQAI